jgi:hypothetical protein
MAFAIAQTHMVILTNMLKKENLPVKVFKEL